MRVTPPELLSTGHDLSAFDCGKPALNEWLKSYALLNQQKGFTRVLVVRQGDRVVGFYGLAPTAVPPATMPRRMKTGRPPDPVPCILLAQLAVDRSVAGHGIGSGLLRHALERCVAAAGAIGGRAVIVRAIDEAAEQYWRSCGFMASVSDPATLFRSMEDIARWLDQASAQRTS